MTEPPRAWFRTWRRGEHANAALSLIVAMPMILAAFGVGFDMMHAAYVRSSLQAGLDMATVAGAAQLDITSSGSAKGDATINRTRAVTETRRVYTANRRSVGMLRCLSGNQARCWSEYKTATVTQNGRYFTYYARDRSANAFLHMVGIPEQNYTLISVARIAQSTQ